MNDKFYLCLNVELKNQGGYPTIVKQKKLGLAHFELKH